MEGELVGYNPTFCTWSLHLMSSMGVRTYEVNAPEIAPAATNPVIDRVSGDACGDRNR